MLLVLLEFLQFIGNIFTISLMRDEKYMVALLTPHSYASWKERESLPSSMTD